MIERAQPDIDEVLRHPDLIFDAVRRGVADAVEEHRRAGRPMVAWENGQVVWIPAGHLPVEQPPVEGEADQSAPAGH